ncbi:MULTISPECIES: hypothetical protein [unclassified Pseudofrankia]|uniref:hypothetical protein n=1 Tax=unclassified Pseudofrankia TaxID=2994372 RepID=UPI0008DA8650|nr:MULTISPECIES: hypothetical protein [unclassified Pseudofrankia]MDT3445351.1 hypothetical protein [Pseudofrankia sp. BMG5.37]OHV51334.1 hypothetical protein BCD48_10095 [Pseudofrankia sp. BMG5.36]
MYLAEDDFGAGTGIAAAAFMIAAAAVIIAILWFTFDYRKTKLRTAQTEDLRQLVQRFEQLAESSMDAQQRVATDVAELRGRTASIEKILRSVD